MIDVFKKSERSECSREKEKSCISWLDSGSRFEITAGCLKSNLFVSHVKSTITFSRSNVQWKWRGADEEKRREKRGPLGGTPAKSLAPWRGCVLSCVVGNGPPARTTSHRYLLVSVSLGGKSISFRRYCADLFVQAPKRSPRPYPTVPAEQKTEKERGDCCKRMEKRDRRRASRKRERQSHRAIV